MLYVVNAQQQFFLGHSYGQMLVTISDYMGDYISKLIPITVSSVSVSAPYFSNRFLAYRYYI